MQYSAKHGFKPLYNIVKCMFLHSGKSKVPQAPVLTPLDKTKLRTPSKVDMKLIQHLEKLSLVGFANKEGIERLEAAIRLGDHLATINTEGIDPLFTVLENVTLKLDEDIVFCENEKDALMSCAAETFEDYFVIPPGNINYIPDDEYYKNLLGD